VQLREYRGQIHQPPFGCQFQDTERAHGRQRAPRRLLTRFLLIHQHEIGMEFLSQQNRLAFSRV
jgi:hypothetical protein